MHRARQNVVRRMFIVCKSRLCRTFCKLNRYYRAVRALLDKLDDAFINFQRAILWCSDKTTLLRTWLIVIRGTRDSRDDKDTDIHCCDIADFKILRERGSIEREKKKRQKRDIYILQI